MVTKDNYFRIIMNYVFLVGTYIFNPEFQNVFKCELISGNWTNDGHDKLLYFILLLEIPCVHR